MSAPTKRLVYVLINSPVGARMYVEKIFKANPFLTKMYNENKGETLSKRDLERLHVHFSSGPRYTLLPFELNTNFFTSNSEPNGPDIIDRMHAEYIQRLREKDTKDKKELK
jgi:hypothetical protein